MIDRRFLMAEIIFIFLYLKAGYFTYFGVCLFWKGLIWVFRNLRCRDKYSCGIGKCVFILYFYFYLLTFYKIMSIRFRRTVYPYTYYINKAIFSVRQLRGAHTQSTLCSRITGISAAKNRHFSVINYYFFQIAKPIY